MTDFERELKISAHKSEAPHLPYDPEINREYNAFIRGAHWSLKSSVVNQMADALRKVCERNDIPEAVKDYYAECSMALAAYNEAIKERGE